MLLYIFERWVENGLLANAVTTACLWACRQDASLASVFYERLIVLSDSPKSSYNFILFRFIDKVV